MKFIEVLHRARARRKPNPTFQERAARAAIAAAGYPPHRNVQAAPQKPPVREGKRLG
jgi:hypothetical protein